MGEKSVLSYSSNSNSILFHQFLWFTLWVILWFILWVVEDDGVAAAGVDWDEDVDERALVISFDSGTR